LLVWGAIPVVIQDVCVDSSGRVRDRSGKIRGDFENGVFHLTNTLREFRDEVYQAAVLTERVILT